MEMSDTQGYVLPCGRDMEVVWERLDQPAPVWVTLMISPASTALRLGRVW